MRPRPGPSVPHSRQMSAVLDGLAGRLGRPPHLHLLLLPPKRPLATRRPLELFSRVNLAASHIFSPSVSQSFAGTGSVLYARRHLSAEAFPLLLTVSAGAGAGAGCGSSRAGRAFHVDAGVRGRGAALRPAPRPHPSPTAPRAASQAAPWPRFPQEVGLVGARKPILQDKKKDHGKERRSGGS